MKICVVGTGYVGLVTGVCLADSGFLVYCVDKEQGKIDLLNDGESPIFEPGLDELLNKNLKQNRLVFKSSIDKEALSSDIFFIAVGTPTEYNGRPNLSYVYEVAKELGNKFRSLDKKAKKIVVVKSTVPPGTTKRIKNIIDKNLGKTAKATVEIAFNPEFLREGSAVSDTFYPSRIVLGVEDKRSAKILSELFKSLTKQDNPQILVTDVLSAEMVKYASNAFLATKISFVNEISHLCELVGANIGNVSKGIGMDKRIGDQFLNAGLGYGGSCFPKDTSALDHLAGDHGHNFHLLKAVIDVNNFQRKRFINKIQKVLGGVEDKTLGILGLAFKPGTDDIRESVAIDMIRVLIERGANIRVFDPLAMDKAKEFFAENAEEIEFCRDPYEVAKNSHALIIATEWDDFSNINLKTLRSNLKKPVIFDGRNLLDPEKVRKAGLQYHAIGGHERSVKNV